MKYSTFDKLMEIQQKNIVFVLPLLSLAFSIFTFTCMWKVFEKMGEEGWVSLIPIYNTFTLYQKIWGCGWYCFIPWLAIIPILGTAVALVVTLKFNMDLARAFGKSRAFGVGLTLLSPVFFAILAFSDVTFTQPSQEQQNPLYGFTTHQNTQQACNNQQYVFVDNTIQQENVNNADNNTVGSVIEKETKNKEFPKN